MALYRGDASYFENRTAVVRKGESYLLTPEYNISVADFMQLREQFENAMHACGYGFNVVREDHVGLLVVQAGSNVSAAGLQAVLNASAKGLKGRVMWVKSGFDYALPVNTGHFSVADLPGPKIYTSQKIF